MQNAGIHLQWRNPAIALGACILPWTGRAQEIEYDWRKSDLTKLAPLESGSVVGCEASFLPIGESSSIRIRI